MKILFHNLDLYYFCCSICKSIIVLLYVIYLFYLVVFSLFALIWYSKLSLKCLYVQLFILYRTYLSWRLRILILKTLNHVVFKYRCPYFLYFLLDCLSNICWAFFIILPVSKPVFHVLSHFLWAALQMVFFNLSFNAVIHFLLLTNYL